MAVDRDDPAGRIRAMLEGFMVSQIVTTAAVLDVPDHLADGPRTAEELAALTATDVDALRRVLRAWCALGLVQADADGRYRGTALAAPLRAGAAGSLYGAARLCALEYFQAWGELLHSLRTGGSAFEHRHGRTLWQHLAGDEEAARAFAHAMSFNMGKALRPVLDGYDFSGAMVVADIGSATEAALLTAILARYPSVRGLAFDLPEPSRQCRAALEAAGLSDRCTVVAGDFLDGVPAGADVYVLQAVLHNWDDERAGRILRNCRAAMPPSGRLLVVEQPVGGEVDGLRPALWDLDMMVLFGGRERTVEEYLRLIGSAGFGEVRVLPTGGALTLFEANNCE